MIERTTKIAGNEMNRRILMRGAAATAGALAAPAFAQSDPVGTTPPTRNWNDLSTAIYPDPAFESFDKRFAKYSGGTTGLTGLWTRVLTPRPP